MRKNILAYTLLLAASLFFFANNTYAQEGLKVDTNGKVGIGTQQPAWNLHVKNSAEARIAVQSTSSTNLAIVDVWNSSGNAEGSVRAYGTEATGTFLGSSVADAVTVNGVGIASMMIGTGNDVPVIFGQNDTEVMRIHSNGNVGIGTTIPRVPLDITYQSSLSWPQTDNNPKSADGIYINNNDPNAKFTGIYFGIDNSSVNNARIAAVSHGDGNRATDLAFAVDNGATVVTERMRITSSGNVGIGYTSPSYKLDVNGAIRCTSLTQTSDVRLKENVKTIENALYRVTQLRGVNFLWKNTSTGKSEQMGVIAQEVEQVFPEAVSLDEKGYKSVSYTKLVAPLIEAIKELKAQNESLIETTKNLKNQNENLKARIEAFETNRMVLSRLTIKGEK